jgi:hypothetical protein
VGKVKLDLRLKNCDEEAQLCFGIDLVDPTEEKSSWTMQLSAMASKNILALSLLYPCLSVELPVIGQ